MNNILVSLLSVIGLATCAAVLPRPFRKKDPETSETSTLGFERRDAIYHKGGIEILDRMGEGVLVVDEGLRPYYANPAARRILGLQPGDLPSRLPSVEVARVARVALEGGEASEDLIEIFFPERVSLKAEASPLDSGVGAVIVLQDVSEEVRTQRVRREFVAHASHELKSPLASLTTLAEALKDAVENDDRPTALRFSEGVLIELDRMGKLVGDLLDLSRLEDPAKLPSDPCDVVQVGRREIGALENLAHKNGLGFIPRLDKEVWIKGDDQQMALLIRNLLQNAIQYTPEKGTVTIDIKGSGDTAVIRVADDGIGIPLESQARIFERFYRVDRARSRDRGGTGLGLAIVKHVTELHGGTIELHSELGQGSTFTVRIPLLVPATTAETTTAEKETA